MAIKHYGFAKWYHNQCEYDWGGSASHSNEGIPCLDANVEAEWKARHQYPCVTYYDDSIKQERIRDAEV